MSYSQEPQPTREVQYTVTVDAETGAVTLSSQFSREEIDNRIQDFLKKLEKKKKRKRDYSQSRKFGGVSLANQA